MKYRADIDGIRAIAVIMVLAFHADISLFSSGFIGVDIFFVISGFLIGLIVNEKINQGSFSLTSFYVSRFWRLQPALISVLIFTLITTSILYLPDDYTESIKSARHALLFIANQYFAKITSSYAAPESDWMPLLHTWSLGIEWQFYFLFPAIFLLIKKITSSKNINYVLFLLLIIFTALAITSSNYNPDKNYYSFTSRVFELLLGVILAVNIHRLPILKPSIASLLGVSALAILFYQSMMDGILPGYPNGYAVITCIATITLIFIGRSHNLASSSLSIKPVVFIGKISYSLYLWHWPILAISKYMGWNSNSLFTSISLLLTILLSILSYYLIENRYRRTPFGIKKTVGYLVILPLAIILIFEPVNSKNQGFPGRFGQKFSHIESILNQYQALAKARTKCIDYDWSIRGWNEQECLLGAQNKKINALMIGDSFSNHSWGFIDVLARDAGIRVQAQSTALCLVLPNIYQYDFGEHKNDVYQLCFNNTKKYYDRIKENHYQYVILGEVWEKYSRVKIINQKGDKVSPELTNARLETELHNAVKKIISSGARPVFIKTPYAMPAKYLTCFYEAVKTRNYNSTNICDKNIWNGSDQSWFSLKIDEIKKQYPQTIVIDPKSAQCNNQSCLTDIDGIPVYRDAGHLTDYASYYFGEKYLKELGNPFR